jgi:hypothetical protein
VVEPLTVLVAARDEAGRVAETVRALRRAFPDAEVLVADDGSRDATAEKAEEAGAVALRLPRRGKGQALSAGERAAPSGRLLLCDADLSGDLAPLADSGADLAIARFTRREGGGFGVAKRVARELIRLRSGFAASEPLSGQRALSPRARAACFPLAPGFGCETRMTIDAVRSGLDVREVDADLLHRPTGRTVLGFVHRGRQLHDALLAAGPLRVNYRGLRLPLLGWTLALRGEATVAAVVAVGLADDLWSGSERGLRAHLRARRPTTGMLKLLAIPALGLLATRRVSGALLVGLAANALNQLDTRPGRALKVYLAAAPLAGAPVGTAVILLSYDLREMGLLGDAGSNALGALLALKSVERMGGRGRVVAIGLLAALNVTGERTSLGALIERTPGLRHLDALGRPA